MNQHVSDGHDKAAASGPRFGRPSPADARSSPPPSNAHSAALGQGDETSLPWPPGRMVFTQWGDGAPLLLVHSVNAAASSHEVAAIQDHAKRFRRVASIDLPGFGRSSRGPAEYSIAFYVDAIIRAAEELRRQSGAVAIDALGLSLSCELLGRAAAQRPDLFRSLAFVTPTGFEKGSSRRRGGSNEPRWSLLTERALNFGVWRKTLFKGLASRPSIRFFLNRTFGEEAPADLVEQAWRTANQPDAEFAPFAFASGKLFAADIRDIYERLDLPIWLAHGTKGAFADFSEAGWLASRSNWKVTPFETGAFPHVQAPETFMPLLSLFLEDGPLQGTGWMSPPG